MPSLVGSEMCIRDSCYIPHNLWQVLSVLELPVLQWDPLWEVSRRRMLANCFVLVFRFRHALFPFTQAGSFSPLLNPSLCVHIKPFFLPVDIHHTQCPCRSFLLELHTLASWRRGVVMVTARTRPSLRGVVYDVHVCFVDRHKKKQLLLKDKHGD